MKTVRFLALNYQHDRIRLEAQAAFAKVYDGSNFILGNELTAFEEEYAAFSEVDYCIGVGSGLDALAISLKSCGLQKEDEVIVPSHTYHATWLAVSHVGAKIIPVEPDERTYNISTQQIESLITKNTKVILPVHMYGQPCDMTLIESIARKNNLLVIEDNAQAHGARWRNKLTGSWGDVNATSFYPTKNLGAFGDGGAITTSNKEKAEFARRFRNYGFQEKNIAICQGVNSRLDELQASLLRVKLPLLNEWNTERKRLAGLYDERLRNFGDVVTPYCAAGADHVYHLYVVRTEYRSQLKEHLLSKGIETMIHYPVPPHLQKAYEDKNFKKGKFPIAEMLSEQLLSLPLYPGLKDEDVDYVSDSIHRFFCE